MVLDYAELPVRRKKVISNVLLSTSWTDIGCSIAILCDDSIWIGKVTRESVSEFSSLLGMEDNKYLKTLKSALNGERNAEFKFCFSKGLFICRCHIDGLNMLFGKIKLKKCSGMEVTIAMIREAFILNFQYKQEIGDLLIENKFLKEELSCISDKLEKMTEDKEEMEMALYKQFHLIINEKKKKISSLSDPKTRHNSSDEDNIEPTEKVEEEQHIEKTALFDLPDMNDMCRSHKVPRRKDLLDTGCTEPGPSKRVNDSPFEF